MTLTPTFTPTTESQGVAVHRTPGFSPPMAFVAEVTARTPGGDLVTVREYGHTSEGAVARAEAAARSRMTGRRYAAGFTAEGFRDESRTKAPWPVGFTTTKEVTP